MMYNRNTHRSKRTAWLDEIRDVPCKDCGNRYPSECMDFDHMPGYEKSFQIMRNIEFSMSRLLAEIEKCEIVCANCHRIRTKRRRDNVL